MKINLKFFFFLFSLISLSLTEKETTIKIVTTKEEEEEPIDAVATDTTKNGTAPEIQSDEPKQQKGNEAESETEKMLKEAKKNSKETSLEKVLTLVVPYQDNEDFMLAPLGLGTPINFAPVQVETTSYKSWISSVLNKNNPSIFSYNIKDSKTGVEEGDWDSIVDNEGTISGNVIYDTAQLGKYKIEKFKFIEAVEFDEEFKDFKNGKLGLGNCHFADESDKEFCLIQRLKENGSINRRVFSIREYSDTHGELIIGDIPSQSKEKDIPLLNLLNEESYGDIEDDQFKMGWLTKISYVLFRKGTDDIKQIFSNNIHLPEGIASFDSSSHYIEAPYSYIDAFEEQMFDKYYDNACRKVNKDGAYMFLCDKKRYEKLIEENKELSMILVMNGYGFEIPMNLLFEQVNEDDYEFFVHFKDFEQNVWNLGHPFFHKYTIIFDQDNQEIGIDGDKIYSLQDETEAELKKAKSGGSFWKVFFYIILLFLIIGGLYLLARHLGIQNRLNRIKDKNLVDFESDDDISFQPGQNVHS